MSTLESNQQNPFALVDCDNFFASCERIFRPELIGKPVAVLSSGDGCIIARSQEVKNLGIPMAAPLFKHRDEFKRHKVTLFSANFGLYGDISRRITAILTSVTPNTEVYSIDEAFLDLSQLKITNYESWGQELSRKIDQWVGVPVSVGVAPTKTLAKLAVSVAKKSPHCKSATIVPGAKLDSLLANTQIDDIWGIGRRLSPKLKANGVFTAADFVRLSPGNAQQLMGIRGRQLLCELQGTVCFPLITDSKPRQSISRTRTFGQDTSNLSTLESAIANFVAPAAFRLRQDNQLSGEAGLFLQTNRHKPGYRNFSAVVKFSQPTADTGSMTQQIIEELGKLFLPNQSYHRAGIWLANFSPVSALQTDLFGRVSAQSHDKSESRMKALDSINERFGRGTINTAAGYEDKSWQPKKSLRSPLYTTDWSDIPKLSN